MTLRRRRRRARAQGSAARVAREGDAAGDAALRRLGARDLPLRAAARHGHDAALGLLWVRSSSRRCSASRAPSWPSGSRGCSTRSCSRRATAARSGSASRSPSSSSSSRAEIVALPAFAAFFSAVDGRTVAAVALADVGICTVGTLFGAMAVAGRARELLLPLLFLPMAIPIVCRRRAAATSGSLLSTTRSSRCSPGRRSSTSSPRPEARTTMAPCDDSPTASPRGGLAVVLAARDGADLLLRADRRRPGLLAADLLLPCPDRAHRVRLLRLGRLEGAARALEARRTRRSRELRRDPPGRHLRRAHADHRLDLGARLLGCLVVVERGPARPLPRPLPLLLRLLHAALLGRARPARARTSAPSTRSSASC